MSSITPGVALVVGINDYRDGIKPLRSAVNDARALARMLELDHGYRATLLLDQDASVAAIREALFEATSLVMSEDTPFLFYFAGHGVARGNEDDGPEGFLLAQDAKMAEPDSWLAMPALREALNALVCRHLLVVLDCCFAGAFRWASTRAAAWDSGPLFDSQFERYLRGRAWQVLTSASHDEEAQDVAPGRGNTRDGDADRTHSPFAGALMRGLAGDADSSRGGHAPDGVITATELYQYAFEELVPAGSNTRQTPGIWPLHADNTGQFIFGNPRCDKNTRPDPPLDDANNPWLGLSAYNGGDAPLFFGRERVIAQLIARIHDPQKPRFVAIVGASGTGKSSVAKAGVLPRLDEQGWSIAHAPRITNEPLGPLSEAAGGLSEKSGRKLLFIDQFEELYTQCRDPERRTAYLKRLTALLDADDTLTVLLTLRTDFEPQPASHPVLAGLWAPGKVVVPAFSAEELRECIEGPAQVRALYFEPPALVGKLVDEVMAMPGALPMLSFALSEMYQRARQRRRESGSADRALTQADYDATGGVVGALHRRATDLHDAGDAATQRTIRRVFLRMLSQDGARLARRRVSREELHFADADDQARVEQVLTDYVDARLLVTDAGDVEPAHDTLIVAWDKLVQWLSDAGPQNLIRSIWRAASDWQSSDRDAGLSWHDDPRLPQALTQTAQLNSLERSFVEASEALRVSRRRWFLFGGASVVAVIAVAAVVAVWQWRAALVQQHLAEDRLARAQSGALLAHAQAQSDPIVQGVLIAEIARRGLPPPDRATGVAFKANAALGDGVVELPGGNGRSLDIRLRENSGSITYRILQGDNEFDTFAWEPRQFRAEIDDRRVTSARYTRSGRSVFATFEDGDSEYWPAPFDHSYWIAFEEPVASLASDDSGYRMVAVTKEGVRLFDLPEGDDATPSRLIETMPGVTHVALDGDGSLLAAGSGDGQVQLIDTASGVVRQSLAMPEAVDGLALDRDGRVLVASSVDGAVSTWTSDGTAMSAGHCGSRVSDLDIAPNGEVVAAACAGRAQLWRADDLANGRTLSAMGISGLRFVTWAGAFAQDGLWLVGLRKGEDPVAWPAVTAAPAGGDAMLREVAARPASGLPTRRYDRETDSFVVEQDVDPNVQVSLSEDDAQPRVTFTVDVPGTTARYTASAGVLRGPPPEEFYVYQNPDRTHVFATATGIFWAAVLFDLTAEPGDAAAQTLTGMEMRDAALSPDGRYLVVAADLMNPNLISDDPKVYRTDSLGTPARRLPGQTFVRDVTMGPKGKRLATTDCRGRTFVWTIDSWTDPIELDASDPGAPWLCGPGLEHGRPSVRPAAAFSADGGTVFSLRDGDQFATWPIDYDALSSTLLQRTHACLTIDQRELFLDETPAEAADGYRQCRAALGVGLSE